VDKSAKWLAEKTRAASKIALIDANNCWIITDVGGGAFYRVLKINDRTPPEGIDPAWKSKDIGSIGDWRRDFSRSAKEDKLQASDFKSRRRGAYMYKPPRSDVYKVHAPKSAHGRRRTALIKAAHEESHHMGIEKVLMRMKRFHWPGMRKAVTEFVNSCSACNLGKAVRKHKHGKYKAITTGPLRTNYAMDFYGVHNQEILNIVDVDSGFLTATVLPDRKADGVARTILNKIVYIFGTPKFIRSDNAAEFMGRVMSGLEKELNIKHVQTGGYNPKANAIVERLHRFIGAALRMLTDEQYENITEVMPAIAFAWNTTPSRARGKSPFELQFGVEPVTPFEAPVVTEEYEEHEILDFVHGQLRAVEKLRAQARTTLERYRKGIEENLNLYGRSEVIKVGDLVKIYCPPSATSSRLRKRRDKHMYQFLGPCIVCEFIEPAMYKVENIVTGRKYMRSICNISKWRGNKVAAPEPDLDDEVGFNPSDIVIGNKIIVVDDPASTKWWIAEVIDIVDDNVHVHYLCTSNTKLFKAKFRYAYVDKTDDKLVLSDQSRQYKKGLDPWTGCVPMTSNFILVDEVRLTKAGILTATSKVKLQDFEASHKHQVSRLSNCTNG
jgi:hypothetical protein